MAAVETGSSEGAPLRLVYFLDGLGSGGAQRQVVELAAALRTGHGVDVRVMAYRAVDAARDRDLHGERLANAGVPVEVLPKRWRFEPTYPARLARRLRALRPDVVHAFMELPALWALLAVRCLPRRHRPLLLASERNALASSGWPGRRVRGYVYARCDAVTVNSQRAVEELVEQLGLGRERLHYLPNGIDLAAWRRAAERPAPFGLEPGRFHVALVGRFGVQKNHSLLLDALDRLGAERIRDWRVWFVGARTGPPGMQEAIEAEVRRRGLAEVVHIAPPTPDIAALMRRLDLLVLPSRYEGFPNVVLEAMALGTPVLAAPVGEVPSLVREGQTGFSFAPEDAADLARALDRASQLAPAERAALAARARALVEAQFRIEAIAEAHLALYRELLASRAAALR